MKIAPQDLLKRFYYIPHDSTSFFVYFKKMKKQTNLTNKNWQKYAKNMLRKKHKNNKPTCQNNINDPSSGHTPKEVICDSNILNINKP